MPLPEIESGFPRPQRGVLTTILERLNDEFFFFNVQPTCLNTHCVLTFHSAIFFILHHKGPSSTGMSHVCTRGSAIPETAF